MIKKLLPIILLIVGLGAGIGGGLFLRPPPTENADAAKEGEASKKSSDEEDEEHSEPQFEYVKMNNQFIIPIVKNQMVKSMVIIALSLEVPMGQKETILGKEPKIRDSFLKIMFDHANMGGFEGEFTKSSKLETLRNALREVAERDMGDSINDVLIMDVSRQDY